jgi:23S rRNA (guanine2445-N2)-methyltransferase / 23S rRNA (guanine2069-N7)-methyltransferase
MTTFNLFISCAKGLEYLLADELTLLGLKVSSISPQGVYGDADLNLIYNLCLWSRLAQRIQLILWKKEVIDQKSLYDQTYSYDWHTLFSGEKTLAIEFHGVSENLRNSMFGAQVMKDAIVDYFRQHNGTRPSIDREKPNIRLHAHLKHNILTTSLDLVGYSLHQRGYRLEAGLAPIKENLAAALLVRAKWPEYANQGQDLYDPCCGSGTLLIEAALMAANIASGLLRADQALCHWNQHDPMLWENIRQQAQQQQIQPRSLFCGSDIDPSVITLAKANAKRAGVDEWITFTQKDLIDSKPVTTTSLGLVICNPPYGERLTPPLTKLYQDLGHVLHTNFAGWNAAILTSNVVLAKTIGLQANKIYKFYNGALECQLYCFTLSVENKLKDPGHVALTDSAEMFANRLRKNFMHLKKWAKRENIQCYRVYDADLPEYAYAIDIYNNYAVLQEYVAPASVPAARAQRRSQDVVHLTPQILELAPENVIHKQRKPQRGLDQYQKLQQMQNFMVVNEGKIKLKVNLHDYLDTGLFLDHRKLRLQFAELPSRLRFLNCFCYTASASVHAAMAGATTTNIDMSATYLRWAEDNFRLNQIDVSRHQFVQYDCLEWLKMSQDKFDVIFLDPPSFSNSKRMSTTLDIQRDHEDLVHLTMRRLAPQGILYFSTNCRTFKLSSALQEHYEIQDISLQTIDLDFKRNPKIHKCYIFRRNK